MTKEIAAIGGVAIEEIFACLSIPGGAAASAILHKVFEKKAAEARDILMEEVSQGGSPAMAEDDAVYIIYRYLRAAQEGSARINLRLLAKTITGSGHGGTLSADEFLYYADILSSLRMEEIILLGCITRHIKARVGGGDKDSDKAAWMATQDAEKELVPSLFATKEDFNACCASILRTGLLSVASGYGGGMLYKGTTLLEKICDWASFEETLAQERG